MKKLRITFSETTVKYEIVCNGQKDLLKEVPWVDYHKLGNELAEKHGIKDIDTSYDYGLIFTAKQTE